MTEINKKHLKMNNFFFLHLSVLRPSSTDPPIANGENDFFWKYVDNGSKKMSSTSFQVL